jgi:hypothetical protein
MLGFLILWLYCSRLTGNIFSAEIDVIGDAPPSKKPYTNGVYFHQPRQVNGSTSASGSGTRTPAGEDWELDCEICYRRGINQVNTRWI